MEGFTVFQMFPTELRLDIWELALAEETSSKRLVILHDLRAIPRKKLCSPLLSVNTESRRCALKLYSIKLSIYQVPPPKPNPLYLSSYIRYKPNDNEIIFPYNAADFFLENTQELLNNIEQREACCAGVLYVSAKADRFLITTNAPWELSWNLITSRIQTPTLETIENVVLAEDRTHYCNHAMYGNFFRLKRPSLNQYINEREPYEMSTTRANLLWRTHIFTGLKRWDHLWYDFNSRNENHKILRKLNGQPDIRQWTATDDSVIGDTKAREEIESDYNDLNKGFPL
ncbi:hypothetical protein F5Y18DRAFT_438669 [Xylariaceae sp. FL1019]|nr:hypothetical protein F5Y18DRAFT_438669 [Xylariaceae sp. FL1019]